MTSRAEAITEAVLAALTVPPMSSFPAARVHRDLAGALQSDDMPAIVVETGDEDILERGVIGFEDRALDVTVTVVAKASGFGASPYSAADAALVEAHARIIAAGGFGGLAFDTRAGRTQRDRDSGADHVGAVRMTYRVQYRTTEASIE